MLIHFYLFITALFAPLIAVPGLRKWAFDTPQNFLNTKPYRILAELGSGVTWVLGLLLLAYEVEEAGANILFAGHTLGEATDLLFMLMAPLVAFKVLFRTQKESIFSTPLDLLVLAMFASLAIISPQFQLTFNLPEIASEAIVLFLAFKILMNRSPMLGRPVCGTVVTSLVLLVVRSL